MGIDQQPLDLLAIEAFSWTPHLETAAEICVTEAKAGRSVALAFIDVDNPDEVRVQPWIRRLGHSPRHKVHRLAQLMRPHGVARVAQPSLTAEVLRQVDEFASQTVGSLDGLLELTYRGAQLGLGVTSSLIWKTRDPTPDPSGYPLLIARYLRAAALVFESACRLIEECRPTSVLIFNGRFACSKPIAEAADRFGVGRVFHERGATYHRYVTTSEGMHDFALERRRIRDAWAKAPGDREDTARAFFERSREGEGIGWTSYTGQQVAGTVPERHRPRRFVFFSTSDYEYAAIQYVTPHTLFASQREAVAFLADWTKRQRDVELVIRAHPALEGQIEGDPKHWNSLLGAGVLFDPPGSRTDSYSLAKSADVVFTYGSTMGIEAAFLGRPSILLSESGYRELGCVYEPRTLDELAALLEEPTLAPKPQTCCLPFGYYYMTFGTPFRFYEPTSLFSGAFMGVHLSTEPEYWRRFKSSRAGRVLRELRNKVRGEGT